MELVYLDYNSTTPLLAEAAAAMAEWQGPRFGNPASQHVFGRRARQTLEEARTSVGEILGARFEGRGADRLIFTSGGTEANHLALFSLAAGHDPRQEACEAIVSSIEHPSVAGPADVLARRGWTIRRLKVLHSGEIDLAHLDELLGERTKFVSVMLANNETGVIQPVAAAAERCRARGIPLHTDAVQMAGKLPVDFRALGVATLSVAAHKFHGPLGTGALLVRDDVRIEPLFAGGFQQDGLRAGTESVALAVGMSAALAAYQREAPERHARMARLRDKLEQSLTAGFAGETIINGVAAARLPHTANLAFLGIERQALLMALDLAGVACSTGAACASGSSEPSTVLAAMGCEPAVLAGALRFSLGATTTEAEIDLAIERILTTCARLAARGVPRSAKRLAQRD